MRKERDGESTKAVVLKAARQAFADHGFAGTSLAMISQACGISDGLILHHFRNKENLYRMVQEDLAAEYLQVINQAAARAQDERQIALQTLRAAFQYWSEDTAYYRISLWAYLENQSALIESEARLTAGLAEKVKEMQIHGQADDRFSPVALLTMTIGPLHFWVRHREEFRRTLRLDASPEQLNRDFEEEFVQMIMKLYQPLMKDQAVNKA
jgi:AcrR family transcriptional regulator